jgi:hypothetical protein
VANDGRTSFGKTQNGAVKVNQRQKKNHSSNGFIFIKYQILFKKHVLPQKSKMTAEN